MSQVNTHSKSTMAPCHIHKSPQFSNTVAWWVYHSMRETHTRGLKRPPQPTREFGTGAIPPLSPNSRQIASVGALWLSV